MVEDSDWVEELLRAEGATPVRDEGFTANLVANLPARRRDLSSWITPSMTVAGAIVAVCTLGSFASAVSALRQIEGGDLLFALLPIGVLLASSAWALSESR